MKKIVLLALSLPVFAGTNIGDFNIGNIDDAGLGLYASENKMGADLRLNGAVVRNLIPIGEAEDFLTLNVDIAPVKVVIGTNLKQNQIDFSNSNIDLKLGLISALLKTADSKEALQLKLKAVEYNYKSNFTKGVKSIAMTKFIEGGGLIKIGLNQSNNIVLIIEGSAAWTYSKASGNGLFLSGIGTLELGRLAKVRIEKDTAEYTSENKKLVALNTTSISGDISLNPLISNLDQYGRVDIYGGVEFNTLSREIQEIAPARYSTGLRFQF